MRNTHYMMVCAVVLLVVARCQAQLLGPTPYLSPNNSPFAADIAGGTVFLENFEDNLLNTPGVTASAGATIGPGGNTDSVDADDGLIDGSGTNGRSFFAPGFPGISFSFNAVVLGGLPTRAGIVWTDGQNPIFFEAFNAAGDSLGHIGTSHADGSGNGGTAEDRFYGIINDGGISRIYITSSLAGGIEVDHLQYGKAVPEPGVVSLIALGAGTLMLRRRG